MEPDPLGLPPGAFAKLDPEDDEVFYEPARLVCHIDDGAIAALTAFYRRILPPDGVLLDLMSSWVSHLPPDVAYARGHRPRHERRGIGRQPAAQPLVRAEPQPRPGSAARRRTASMRR